MNLNNIIIYIGLTGGFIQSICLLPQIYKALKTKSTNDISFYWQFLYISGISGILTYCIYFDLKVIYIPAFLEFSMILFLTLTKVYHNCKNYRIGHGSEALLGL